jgi:hypothetical protein
MIDIVLGIICRADIAAEGGGGIGVSIGRIESAGVFGPGKSAQHINAFFHDKGCVSVFGLCGPVSSGRHPDIVSGLRLRQSYLKIGEGVCPISAGIVSLGRIVHENDPGRDGADTHDRKDHGQQT